MPIEVLVKSEALTRDAQRDFRHWARGIWGALENIAERHGIPACRVQAVLTDDFVAEVRKLSGGTPSPGLPEFTAERLGGIAVGKNVPLSEEGSEVAVVFDGTIWHDHHLPEVKVLEFLLIAHELSHPIIERGRLAAGVYEGVDFPSITSGEVARSMSLILAGEYRADRLSDLIVRQFATAGERDAQQPVGGWGILGHFYIERLGEILGKAHPEWPDTVQAYREGRLTLDDLWGKLVTRLDQTLNILAHAEALAEGTETPDPLATDQIASLSAVRLYLAEPWAVFMQAVRRVPLLPSMNETLRWEDEVRSVGEECIREIWRRLGITGTDLPGRQLWLDVEEPLRE